MDLEIGIAGWILSGEILREKTLTLLEFPKVCASYGVKTVELCSAFFAGQDTRYLNDLRRALEDNGLTVRNIAVEFSGLAAGWTAVASPRTVNVEMRGPGMLLAARASDVRAFADLESLDPGAHQVTLRIQIPGGVTMVKAIPPAVFVTVVRP